MYSKTSLKKNSKIMTIFSNSKLYNFYQFNFK